MQTQRATWAGTKPELSDLELALARFCECKQDVDGVVCAGHVAFEHEQRFLDGLLFMRRWLARNMPRAGKRIVRQE